MVNHVDLPTEIERFGQVFFCQSQFVIGAICRAEQPVSANKIAGNRITDFLCFICQFKGALGGFDCRFQIFDLTY